MLACTEGLACKKDNISPSALKPEISISSLSLPLLVLIQDVKKIKNVLPFPSTFLKNFSLISYCLFLHSFFLKWSLAQCLAHK